MPPAGQQHEASLDLECGTAEAALAVWGALRLELEPGIEEGRARGRVEGSRLLLELGAPDLSGLRAALTTATRLFDASLRVVQGRR